MSAAAWTKEMRHVLCAAAIALAGLGAATQGAWAQAQVPDEDDEIENSILNTDKRLFNSLLGTLGLGSTAPEITYRERSPLVVPQGRDLPPPGKAVRNGDWPVEPEVKAKRAAATLNKSGRSATPVDPAKPISGTPENYKTGYTGKWIDDPKGPKDQDFLSMLVAGKLWGSPNEVGKFEGEPPRTSLADPPSGYLTPSPAAPYGVTPLAGAYEKKEVKP
jgi:hypothetical protein